MAVHRKPPLGIAGIKALRQTLPRLFGLDISAAEEAKDYVNRWLANQRIGKEIIY
jgi:hypothetical protein